MTSLDTSKLIALKLSALNETDFNWIYSQLHDDIKVDLDPIIREIKEIGFEIDSGAITTLVKKIGINHESVVKDINVQTLDDSAYDDIAEVFKSEPDFLFNTLICISNWKWQKDQRLIDKSKAGSAKVIKNIKSKSLLQKSIISRTVFFLQIEENDLSKNKQVSKFQNQITLSSYINKVIRPAKKWMF